MRSAWADTSMGQAILEALTEHLKAKGYLK